MIICTINSMPITGSYRHILSAYLYIYSASEPRSNVANVISWFIFITVMVESIQMAFSDRYKYYIGTNSIHSASSMYIYGT